MSTIKQQLCAVLPGVLPSYPSTISGTALIEKLRETGVDKTSDQTLRYYFATLSSDHTSPIAKVSHGQGYYKRETLAGDLMELKEAHAMANDLHAACERMLADIMLAKKFAATIEHSIRTLQDCKRPNPTEN